MCVARGLQACSHSCKWASLTSPRMDSRSSLWRPGSVTAGSCWWLSGFSSTGASWTHMKETDDMTYTHARACAHTQSHTFIHMCTHLQSLGLSLSICRAVPEPGAGWADGSPSNDNKVMDYSDLLGCMFVSNNITSCWWLTSRTSFCENKPKKKQTKNIFSISSSGCSVGLRWKVAECVETPQTLEAVSQVSSSLLTNTTLLLHAQQLPTWALNTEMNAEINPGLSQKKEFKWWHHLVSGYICGNCGGGQRCRREWGEEGEVCEGIIGACVRLQRFAR